MSTENPPAERLAELEDDLNALTERVEAMSRKQKRLEQRLPQVAAYEDGFDQYDAPVVARLERGEGYTRAELVSMYRNGRNSVTDEQKIKSRIRGLVADGVLEPIESGRWRCIGE